MKHCEIADNQSSQCRQLITRYMKTMASKKRSTAICFDAKSYSLVCPHLHGVMEVALRIILQWNLKTKGPFMKAHNPLLYWKKHVLPSTCPSPLSWAKENLQGKLKGRKHVYANPTFQDLPVGLWSLPMEGINRLESFDTHMPMLLPPSKPSASPYVPRRLTSSLMMSSWNSLNSS